MPLCLTRTIPRIGALQQIASIILTTAIGIRTTGCTTIIGAMHCIAYFAINQKDLPCRIVDSGIRSAMEGGYII